MTKRKKKCDCAKVELKKKNQLPAQLVCALICVKIETVGGWVRAYCQYVVSVLQASKIKEVRSTYRARQSILGRWSVTPNLYWSDKGRRRYVVVHVCKCWKWTCSAELLSPPAGSMFTYILSTRLWRHMLHQCSWQCSPLCRCSYSPFQLRNRSSRDDVRRIGAFPPSAGILPQTPDF